MPARDAPAEWSDLLVAAIDLLRRTRASKVQVRWHDEEQPTVWMVVAAWALTRDGVPGELWEAAAGMSPEVAAMRLLERMVEACGHCGRPARVSDEWRDDRPDDGCCWLVFDPETTTFRRSCEGETTGRAFGWSPGVGPVGRNDPCPCGSGEKWKRCHGA